MAAPVTPHLRRAVIVGAIVLGLGSAGALTSCGSGDSDPDTTGPTKQAVEQLEDFGLSRQVAECVTEELGADTVVEATDLTALAEGEPYQDAVKGCEDD